LVASGKKYQLNPGDGAFYGPKIDFIIKDSLGRMWQCATIQCDFALPKRFNLAYVDSNGQEQQPIMLHRVLLGSLERFTGALVEHYAGNLPLWLAPVQVIIISIGPQSGEYCCKLQQTLINKGVRVKLDNRNETLNKRIRESELEKVPYVLVVGEREAKAEMVSVRKKGKGDTGSIGIDKFLAQIEEEIHNKVIRD
jgi:threonyl-tRNA synthetase